MTDTTRCPGCGATARVLERFVLESTDETLEHARTSCPRGHHFVLGVEALTRSPLRPTSVGRTRRIMLLCSAFNGLTQRVWIELRAAGHEVTVQRSGDDDALRAELAAVRPELVICPFLRERVPDDVWRAYPTIVIHPGPRGDRGPSSLDWAIMGGAPVWGVTALQAIDEMDAGPIWASRTFLLDADPPRKSDLYNGSVTDAAVALVHEVVARFADPGFVPEPLDYTRADVVGRLRPAARQCDRDFSWSEPTEHVLRRIRAADGAPGVYTQLCGVPVAVFDAHRAAGRRWWTGTARHHRRPPPRRRPRPHRRRRCLDRSAALLRRQRPGPQAARHDDPRRPPRRRPRDQRTGRLPGDRLPPGRAGRPARLPLLQRRDVHRPVPQAVRGPAARDRPGHARAAAARRAAVLQRPAPGRHRRGTGPGCGGVGQHRRDRRRVRGDHHLRGPAGRVRTVG